MLLINPLTDISHRLWLKELEQSDALLASQIHVFNSFFYKKLNHHQKGYAYVYCCVAVKLIVHFSSTKLGYESVRKWTSKFDIFEKKYIIVPINEQ
jgi:Ulp1 family protease